MKLIRSNPVTTTNMVGQQPPLTPVVTTTWTAVVLDDDNVQRTLSGLTFDPSLPANAGLLYLAVTPASPLTPTTKADWSRAMQADYNAWLRWKTTRVEAQARSMAAAVITALTNQENAAWTAYAADVTSWNSAT